MKICVFLMGLMTAVLFAMKSLAVDAGGCAAFSSKIATCEKFTCEEPHPFMKSFKIKRTIFGLESGKCRYEETMPNGGLMTCSYKSEMLPKISKWYALQEQDYNPLESGECTVSGYK